MPLGGTGRDLCTGGQRVRAVRPGGSTDVVRGKDEWVRVLCTGGRGGQGRPEGGRGGVLRALQLSVNGLSALPHGFGSPNFPDRGEMRTHRLPAYAAGDTASLGGSPPYYTIEGRTSVDILKSSGYKISALQVLTLWGGVVTVQPHALRGQRAAIASLAVGWPLPPLSHHSTHREAAATPGLVPSTAPLTLAVNPRRPPATLSPQVESAIMEHPSVGEVAVLGVPDPTFGEVITALVAPAAKEGPAAPLNEGELQRHCRERLAPYQVCAGGRGGAGSLLRLNGPLVLVHGARLTAALPGRSPIGLHHAARPSGLR